MAAQTLFGKTFRISAERGQWRELGPQARGLATWHPSAVLRTPREARCREAYAELVTDLREVAAALAALSDADGAAR
mgnify:CR=1 FL=1|jgi:DNA polymerase